MMQGYAENTREPRNCFTNNLAFFDLKTNSYALIYYNVGVLTLNRNAIARHVLARFDEPHSPLRDESLE